jgi:alpha-beta hydrolase superfamily lysophospholipase
MKKLNTALLLVAIVLSCMKSESAAQEEPLIINFSTEDGGRIEATHFNASEENVIIYAHGAVFNKESWYFLAEQFQSVGIASLCIDFRGYGNSTATNYNEKYYDILGAIEYLTDLGYSKIHIIGGSMGGAATLKALSRLSQQSIAKVVLLAPAGGPPIQSSAIDKLIVVSRDEGLYSRVKSIYEVSADPKTLKEYDGSAHAQHMFKEKYVDELTQLIIGFIVGD